MTAANDQRRSKGSSNRQPVVFTTAASYTSYSSSHSSASYYPSSCSSISPPRNYYHNLNTASPPSRRPQANEHNSAREHLASLIRKHGPPTPVSSSSSLRKLTSTSPINTSFLPSDSVETPPASPAPVEEVYESTAGSRPIPIPRANLSRSFDDLPLTPLTGRFDHQYLAEHPIKDSQSSSSHQRHSRNEKSSRKKKSQPTSSSVSTSISTTSRSSRSKKIPMSGPSLTMSHESGPVSPKPVPKDSPMYLGNLPRFHPAVYQSPNNTPNASLSSNTSNHHPRSFGYRVASGGSGSSREALRQYRELVAASVSLSRNTSDSSDVGISAPRLDPLGSPGPVTPLALEEAESYLSARSDDYISPRQADSPSERERYGSTRTKDAKGR
ncbi:hypothetical protein TMatcc_004428 [Talaromyces marneffei ATCC 18224]|uniref:uncharacterized protein n=1 Tax=Talaromyces marneffei TaxID=37727 RepID=UPI0012A973F0|nr:uncharacterized protein EYB26_000624 [Talaromyces marneffei]KAE8557004.1 hypothetical protein EYB25_001710 [Talaromyces marneffei]QGA12979.1 hypothetical protein EYB26_000624 [Talaromyces marneffei]